MRRFVLALINNSSLSRLSPQTVRHGRQRQGARNAAGRRREAELVCASAGRLVGARLDLNVLLRIHTVVFPVLDDLTKNISRRI